MAFFVFNDIKIKVWKFENKPRAYFWGAYFRDCFRVAIWGAYFRGGLFSGFYGMLMLMLILTHTIMLKIMLILMIMLMFKLMCMLMIMRILTILCLYLYA